MVPECAVYGVEMCYVWFCGEGSGALFHQVMRHLTLQALGFRLETSGVQMLCTVSKCLLS